MSHTNPTARRTWPWVILVVVVVVAIIVGISLVSSALGAKPTTGAATAPPPVEPTRTATATPTVSATAHAHTSGFSGKDVTRAEGAIEDDAPAKLYSLLSSPVHVQFAASDFDSNRSRDNAVTDLAYTNGLTGWNWKLDDGTLATFRAGAYGDSFPASAIVGESAEGYVISFTITAAKISAIFVSKSVALVTAPKS